MVLLVASLLLRAPGVDSGLSVEGRPARGRLGSPRLSFGLVCADPFRSLMTDLQKNTGSSHAPSALRKIKI